MKDLTIKQQIANIDIASLSTTSDFTHFLNLLKQVDNADFVKNIQLKLNENPLFSQFKKEQQNERTQGMEKITAQARLSEIMEKSKGKKGDVLSPRSVIQNQINNANYQTVAAMYEEILRKEGAKGVIEMYEKYIKDIAKSLEKDLSPEEFKTLGKELKNQHLAGGNALYKSSATQEQIDQFLRTGTNTTAAFLQNENANPENPTTQEVIDAQLVSSLLQTHPELVKKYFKEDGKGGYTNEFKKPLNMVEQAELDKAIDEKKERIIDAGTSQQNAEIVANLEKQSLARNAIPDFAENLQQSKDKNGNIKATQKVLNRQLGHSVKLALDEPTVGIEGLKQQIADIKKQYDKDINLLGPEFDQFSLYYVNAQRVMKEKGITFAQFLTSPEGDTFGLARQLLNTDYIKGICKQDETTALELLELLGANRTQATVVLKAFKEIENQPQVFEHLTNKTNRDYKGKGFEGNFLGKHYDIRFKEAEITISEDGVKQLLDKQQTKDLALLNNKNLDYKQELENIVAQDKAKQKEQKEEVKTARKTQNSLSEEEPTNKTIENQNYGENVIRSVAKDGGVRIENNQELEKPNTLTRNI